ncbi:MAG: nicotinate-nucleotide adenylyltransferase [Acidobacteria bacterium]|nr:MAG: nicotinate-nucleotide adenylyltransferase [Acidobacteriota bacterium]
MTGLLGGTFDPVHLGHLDVAHAALRALSLDQVLFIPANIPPHRHAPRASGADRLAMVTLAIAGEPRFAASAIELEAAGTSYTAVTIDRMVAAGRTREDLCFIAGADAFAGVASWHDYPALLDRCHFAVVSRPGFPASAVRTRMPAFADRMIDAKDRYQTPARTSIFLIDAPTAPVSSTDVRACIDRGAPLTGLVPDVVAGYIDAHRLYTREAHGH